MPINFPDAPNTNDQFTSGGKTWLYTGNTWELVARETGIPNNSITSGMLSNSSVTVNKIADDAVTTIKLANSSVTSDKIVGNSITNAKLSDDAVSTDKLSNGAVTLAKMATTSLTIGNTSITLGNTASSVFGLSSIGAANAEVTNFLTLNGVKEHVVIESFLGGTEKIYIGETQTILKNTDATENFTIDLRAYNDGVNPIEVDSIMSLGDMITVSFICKNGSTPYRCTDISVNGSTQGRTLLWQGGTAPAAGNANSSDVYTITIIKTGTATFSVFAGMTRFA